MINTKTDLYCIIGNPVSHSKSPMIHNSAFSYHNLNAVYLAFNIETEKLKETITGLKLIKELKGMNVTVPHKINIIPFLDSIDPIASEIGSVNTVKNTNGKWEGSNTDWYGVLKTLEINKINNRSKTLIIGAGGATPAVIYGLQKYGINNISITNRTNETAQKTASKFSIDFLDYNNYRNVTDDFSLIINTTTLNFNDMITTFNQSLVYFDLKYYSDFHKDNIKYIDGKDMLLHQAALSYKIWTNKDAPIEIMQKAMLTENYQI